MKRYRNYLFIGITSIALCIVLIIQVNWIFQSAKVKETLFNEKANLVLSKTAEALAADSTTQKNLGISVGNTEEHVIDSLFNHYMTVYNIHIDYYFEIKQMDGGQQYKKGFTHFIEPQQPGSFQTCIEEGTSNKNRIELKLVFPKKEKFILAEMGVPFISSVVLILLVLIMSWRTILSLMKEKRISENTTEFLNNMTHEFKTPLTNIALAGRLITKDANIQQEEKVKHYSGIILEENEKLRLQVEQVLSMTALERGEIPLQKAMLNFHQLIRDALKSMSIQIENKQGLVELKLEATSFVILGDKNHLQNALCNLFDNAVKYAKGRPELSIYTYSNAQQLIIKIIDNGIGIDKEYQKKVFNTYFRIPTGNVHNVKGFGIGLAYTKSIFELHGGSIELESEPGMGTTFIVILPYA